MEDVSAARDRPASGRASARLVAEREFAEGRLASLAQAIREHEGTVRGPIQASRPHDRRLYSRLRDICAERIGR